MILDDEDSHCKNSVASDFFSDHNNVRILSHATHMIDWSLCGAKYAWSHMSAMSNFEETLDDIENRFITNPEDASLLAGTIIELGNLIENDNDTINRGRLSTLKKIL